MSAVPASTHWSNRNPELRLEMISVYTNMTEDDAMVTFCQRGCVITDTPGYYSIHEMKFGPFEKSLLFRCAREEELYRPPISSKDYPRFQATLPEFKISFDGHLVNTQNTLHGNMRSAAMEQGVPTYIEREIILWLQSWGHTEAAVVCRKKIFDVGDILRMTKADRLVRFHKNRALGIIENPDEGCTRVSMAMKEARFRNLGNEPAH